jgi:hypothetical protein
VRDGKFTDTYAKTLLVDNETQFTPEVLENLTRGASYCPTLNALQLQKAASTNNEIIVLIEEVNRQRQRELKQVGIPRNWCSMIYNVQVEDGKGYGCWMKALPVKNLNKLRTKMSCVATALVACVGSSSMLYHLVDQKEHCHSYNNYTGYLLTYIHNTLMTHCSRPTVKQSPFSGAEFDCLCKYLINSVDDSVDDETLLCDDPAENMSLTVSISCFLECAFPC